MRTHLTRVPLTLTALALSVCLAASPVLAQPADAPAAPTPPPARLARVFTPAPIGDAARSLANAEGRTTSAASPARKASTKAERCGNRVVLGVTIGAGVGFGGGYGLLVASGGSDSAVAILRGTAVIGAVAGLVGGLIACEQ